MHFAIAHDESVFSKDFDSFILEQLLAEESDREQQHMPI